MIKGEDLLLDLEEQMQTINELIWYRFLQEYLKCRPVYLLTMTECPSDLLALHITNLGRGVVIKILIIFGICF